MNIVLATGIFLPDIGGPATYVARLAAELHAQGEVVTVITFGNALEERYPFHVVSVSRTGGTLRRWWRYSRALVQHAHDADIIYAFSSVSTGIPLWLARLKGPATILRLGGDFLWERAVERGTNMSLRQWYASDSATYWLMQRLLRLFDALIFSTHYQEQLYEKHFSQLPPHTVIENAYPTGIPLLRRQHHPLRLLFLGRLVACKNLFSLLEAVQELPDVRLTIAGEGPLREELFARIRGHALESRVSLLLTQQGEAILRLFLEHDLLLLPSLTELSPNSALEARVTGLPVLLTEETGLSPTLLDGMVTARLRSASDIASAIRSVQDGYEAIASRAAAPLPPRSWKTVSSEHLILFQSLL